MPTFGAFFLGREIAKSDTIPDWATKELMDTIQKKEKGQQEVIVGAMYRGACLVAVALVNDDFTPNHLQFLTL